MKDNKVYCVNCKQELFSESDLHKECPEYPNMRGNHVINMLDIVKLKPKPLGHLRGN